MVTLSVSNEQFIAIRSACHFVISKRNVASLHALATTIDKVGSGDLAKFENYILYPVRDLMKEIIITSRSEHNINSSHFALAALEPVRAYCRATGRIIKFANFSDCYDFVFIIISGDSMRFDSFDPDLRESEIVLLVDTASLLLSSTDTCYRLQLLNEYLPALSAGVFTVIQIIKSSKLSDVSKLRVLNFLDILVSLFCDFDHNPAQLAVIMPAICSVLFKLVTSDTTTNTDLVSKGLKILGDLLTQVLSCVPNKLSKEPPKTTTDVQCDDKWLRETIERLTPINRCIVSVLLGRVQSRSLSMAVLKWSHRMIHVYFNLNPDVAFRNQDLKDPGGGSDIPDRYAESWISLLIDVPLILKHSQFCDVTVLANEMCVELMMRTQAFDWPDEMLNSSISYQRVTAIEFVTNCLNQLSFQLPNLVRSSLSDRNVTSSLLKLSSLIQLSGQLLSTQMESVILSICQLLELNMERFSLTHEITTFSFQPKKSCVDLKLRNNDVLFKLMSRDSICVFAVSNLFTSISNNNNNNNDATQFVSLLRLSIDYLHLHSSFDIQIVYCLANFIKSFDIKHISSCDGQLIIDVLQRLVLNECIQLLEMQQIHHSSDGFKIVNRSVMLSCCLLETIGNSIVLISKLDYQYVSLSVADLLTPVLRCLTSIDCSIKDSALCTLHDISVALNVESISHLIYTNINHLVHQFAVQLRHFDLYPMCPLLFIETLHLCRGHQSVYPVFASLIDEILVTLDEIYLEESLLMLKMLLHFEQSLLLWFPPSTSQMPVDISDQVLNDDENETKNVSEHIELTIRIMKRARHLVMSSDSEIQFICLGLLHNCFQVFTFANPKREFHWGSKLNQNQPEVSKEALKRINLMYHDNHFDVITKLGGYFSASGFCHECNKAYHDVRTHRCVEKCFGCQRVNCRMPQNGEPEILCNDCNRYFRHQECFDYHKSTAPPIKVSLCRRYHRCRHCQRLIVQTGKKVVKHTCGEIYCKCCKSLVPKDHQCYISTISSYEEDQLTNADDEGDIGEERAKEAERKAGIVPPASIKETAQFRKAVYAYYDCEAYLDDSGQHNCNLVVVRWNNNEKVFKGDTSSVDFCKWAMSKDHSDWTFVAHNAKRYDNYFIMNYLTTHLSNIPTIITSGGSVMLIQIQAYTLRFIDSCCFIPRPLAKLPSMFGIQDTVKKGFFPHKFNRPQKYDYAGPMPDIAFYEPENMSAARREEFETWYQARVEEDYHFVFWDELISYCRDDVRVLQECVGIYRQETFDMTNVDPLTKVTLASACNAIYRKNFMPANSIGIIPANGYDKHNMQSREALIWLEWMAHKTGLDIQHTYNGNEEVVHVNGRKYMLDGQAELPNGHLVAFEFNGCYYHGCPTCYTPDTHNTLKIGKMGELHRNTIDKEKFLKSAGWTVNSIWECEFKKQQTADSELKDFYENYDHLPPINPRDAFFGGRTEAVKLHHRVSGTEKLSYMDINSLYPWVQKTQKFPTGHPTIIRGDNIGDIADYFGLIKCRVIPPTNLYHPVLPMHIGKKLKFTLCFKCAETNNVDEQCTHTVEERSVEGTWTSVELEMAVKLGYRITKIYEVWHFEETSTDLFAGYVRLFSKEKIQSKGYPSWVQTEDDKDVHIKGILDHEGIVLDKSKIGRNPGREAIAKLCLNTLWGKFGQRDNLGQTKFVRNAAELWTMFTSDQFKIKDVVFPSDMLAQVTYTENTEFVTAGINTNVVIAAFTTAYARLKLYQSVLPLHKQVCYMDTDSIVFIDPNPNDLNQYRPPVGEHLGVYKDEVGANDTMIEFATAGPKNYSFKTANGDSTTKVKGITLNELTQQVINLDTIRDFVTQRDPTKTVEVNMKMKFKLDNKGWNITTVSNVKKYRFFFDKRVIYPLPENRTTPFGYIDDGTVPDFFPQFPLIDDEPMDYQESEMSDIGEYDNDSFMDDSASVAESDDMIIDD